MVADLPLKFSIVFVFLVVGLFGNINLILIYLRTTQLRSKTGFLIFLAAIFHTICLIFSPSNATVILHLNNVNPTVCMVMSSVYITGLSMAGTVTIMMAFDLLLNMVLPFRYRLMTPRTFCLIIFPNLCLPIIFCVFAFLKGDDIIMWYEDRNVSHVAEPTLYTCDEQYELKEDLRVWFIGKNVLLTATTIVYLICLIILKFIGLNPRTKKQIIKCTMVIVCCFVIACMFHITCTVLLLTANMHQHTREELMNFSRLHMYLCLSYNFYICIWRSSKLRGAFFDNLRCCMVWRAKDQQQQQQSSSKISSSHSPRPQRKKVTITSFD